MPINKALKSNIKYQNLKRWAPTSALGMLHLDYNNEKHLFTKQVNYQPLANDYLKRKAVFLILQSHFRELL